MVSDSQSIRIIPSSRHCNCNPYYSLQCYLITLLLPNFLSNIESQIPNTAVAVTIPFAFTAYLPYHHSPQPYPPLLTRPRVQTPLTQPHSPKRPPPNPGPSLPPGPVPRKGLSPACRVLQQPPLPPVATVAGLASFFESHYQHRSCKPGCAAGPGYRYWRHGRGGDPVAARLGREEGYYA